ncbi:uncharacterized protein LOC123661454 [Melitaea cinxia]|uniref:uncharacterized protein LOC123661454 n=1 Tax=Melitaea cinxia TaxID=113334 RepID=UPI001E26F56E|nr:uncharacterized protein LOC123661454 [Melitaea cinxia]
MCDDSIEVINKMLDEIAKANRYDECQIKIKSVSSGGANYTSYLHHVTISAPGKDDLKLFVKLAALGEKIRSAASFIIFEIEDFFYKKLLKTYEAIEERNMVSSEHRLVTPKFYASNDKYCKEVLILEDMTSKGYQAFNRFESIDWKYASKSIQNLAKLHALSIAWSIDDPKDFENNKSLEFNAYISIRLDLLKNSIKNTIEVTRPENKEKIEKFCKEMTEYDVFRGFLNPIRRPVIVHGDYRPSNLLHRKLDNGEYDVVSVDYQTLFKSNPMFDLMYFIFTGSDKNFRKNYFKRTVEHYYKELRAALERLNLAPDDIYPREDFEYELEKMMPFGLLISTFALPIITVQEEDAPKVTKDIDLNDFMALPSSLYKERINDIIDDYIDMGLL